MPVHFTDEEMALRAASATAAVGDAGIDAILIFKQESMYWLTGYDTFGFSMFQCLVLTNSGRQALLTRMPDRGTAQYTSNLVDIRIWHDVEGMNPTVDLIAMLDDLGLRGAHVGIELDSYGLKASNWELLETALDGFCTWVDASTLMQELRRTKSPAEIAYIRRAAELADDAWDAAVARAGAGVSEADVLADMQDVVLRGGGDYAGNGIIIGSGPAALMVRYTSGRRTIGANDQLTLEWCGVQRHYHAAMMRTMLVGEPSAEHVAMHAACRDALLACEAAIKPGATLGEVFDVHAEIFDEAGFAKHRMNACGYGMGAVYAPIWVDWPMLYHGNPLTFDVNQVYFLHMILLNLDDGRAMNLGHSIVVTEGGCERLSRSSLDLVVK
ncbi:MAG: aminopeptidase P family protein [Acidimicrobiales bacterium]|nr:aminopeptidase P family protein [Acidimicrobiales bacterium]RZV46059.1 MAG: aminopeptidase P family protein [Acidimicrobiales bacterium]